MAIRWIRATKETGLRAIGAMPRGARLVDTATDKWYMFISSEYNAMVGDPAARDQWRFYILKGNNERLRSKTVFPTFEAAKEAADRYWKANRAQIIADRTTPKEQKQQILANRTKAEQKPE